MSQVFISYSRKDKAFVNKLAESLETAGFDVWWDVDDLVGGDIWESRIQQAIEESQYCLVVLSPDAIRAHWVASEYNHAIRLGIRVIPVFYKTCAIPMGLSTLHYVDFRQDDYELGVQRLLLALSVPIESIPKTRQTDSPKKYLDYLRDPIWQGIAGIITFIAFLWTVYDSPVASSDFSRIRDIIGAAIIGAFLTIAVIWVGHYLNRRDYQTSNKPIQQKIIGLFSPISSVVHIPRLSSKRVERILSFIHPKKPLARIGVALFLIISDFLIFMVAFVMFSLNETNPWWEGIFTVLTIGAIPMYITHLTQRRI